MLYVYQETDSLGSVLLVKAETKEDVERVLKVGEGLKLLGSFTTVELEALNVADFVIVKS